MEDIKDFFVEIQTILEAKGAKGWTEVYPTIETEATIDGNIAVSNHFGMVGAMRRRVVLEAKVPGRMTSESTYVLLTEGFVHDRQPMAQHLISVYDGLFEACYTGDNDTIEKMCLPAEGQGGGGPSPANISIRQVDTSMSQYDLNGHTPLSAAIAGCRWSTAKLVLAIATAQYHPADKKDEIKCDLDIHLDDHSDNETCGSDDSDMTVEQQEIKFVDIATQPHPRTMQEVAVRIGPTVGQGSREHDLDAFVHIADLYQSLALSIQTTSADALLHYQGDILVTILLHDQVDILDEYIHRTGEGLDTALVKKNSVKTGEESAVAIDDANKMYLGLNVHGKKRIDLAQKNDPDAAPDTGQETKTVPLLWKAIGLGAKAVVKYIGSDRPFTSYKAYSTSIATRGDEKARWTKRVLFDGRGD
ncbi:hypothetical protein CVT25_006348 [Psilocybe cyanescens]|uniref:Uncharacterized protein n=1 Tax=Psilocybe cyanescens TaxID=93625 RepID=A0A409WYJ6_PSICY|nr:hypothetical protein CVT25_006348 [Psilocybe cyanescens]